MVKLEREFERNKFYVRPDGACVLVLFFYGTNGRQREGYFDGLVLRRQIDVDGVSRLNYHGKPIDHGEWAGFWRDAEGPFDFEELPIEVIFSWPAKYMSAVIEQMKKVYFR